MKVWLLKNKQCFNRVNYKPYEGIAGDDFIVAVVEAENELYAFMKIYSDLYSPDMDEWEITEIKVTGESQVLALAYGMY